MSQNNTEVKKPTKEEIEAVKGNKDKIVKTNQIVKK